MRATVCVTLIVLQSKAVASTYCDLHYNFQLPTVVAMP